MYQNMFLCESLAVNLRIQPACTGPGDQTWQWKIPKNGGLDGKHIYKWEMFHCRAGMGQNVLLLLYYIITGEKKHMNQFNQNIPKPIMITMITIWHGE